MTNLDRMENDEKARNMPNDTGPNNIVGHSKLTCAFIMDSKRSNIVKIHNLLLLFLEIDKNKLVNVSRKNKNVSLLLNEKTKAICNGIIQIFKEEGDLGKKRNIIKIIEKTMENHNGDNDFHYLILMNLKDNLIQLNKMINKILNNLFE